MISRFRRDRWKYSDGGTRRRRRCGCVFYLFRGEWWPADVCLNHFGELVDGQRG